MAKQKQKNVYFFGEGRAEGDSQMKFVLGGKGANLAEMTNMGIPVPAGFTIAIDVCAAYYANKKKYPPGIQQEIEASIKRLEKVMKKKLGDPADPLLVSIRSGAADSMPGMMDTILNLGMNDESVIGLANKTGNARFAWDAYRRFIQMYSDVVLGVDKELFEEVLEHTKEEKNVELDTALDAKDLQAIVDEYKKIVHEETGKNFPQSPYEQLWGSIEAVFRSWMNERAIKYRDREHLQHLTGTAVNVQSMVFGNYGDDSGTGVCFSRDPSTGDPEFYGEYLMNAQGEDVVAGIRTPHPISLLEKENPEIYEELVAIKNRLEKHFKDMQDIEFTVEKDRLYLLQTRSGKRTGTSAVKCAIDMVNEGLISKETAVMRVTPGHLDQLLHPMIEPSALKDAKPVCKGLNASPGAASGRIVFNSKDAEEWHGRGEKVILLRKETSPEDIKGMDASQGIITSTGGNTSHAAVVARGWGKPCIVGAKGVSVRDNNTAVIKEKTYHEGDWLTIDGSSGEIFEGALPLVEPKELSKDATTFLQWCDEVRSKSMRGRVKGFAIRTNADTPEDAKKAVDFGAQGIGLCRTEHMFFDKEKLTHFRAMIVAETKEEREEALKKILPLQRKDFFGIFKAMGDRPVTIRLLDPPLHEFVPHSDQEIDELAQHLGISFDELKPKVDKLKEANPMLGHRGCRLGITYPEIYDMQVEAIALAAVDCVTHQYPAPRPEIMIPLIISIRELKILRPNAEKVLARVFDENNTRIPVEIGTMIEVPRAAIRSANIAHHADFFSFGTNDLTQMTLGFSRDDVGAFLPDYIEQEVLDTDPFASLDQEGTGKLVEISIAEGRKTNPDLKIGVCGEHGGDPKSIDFFYRAGLSYVSCSPFRVPLARLAGAQAVLEHGGISSGKKVKVIVKAAKAGETAASKAVAKAVAPKIAAPKIVAPKAAAPKAAAPKAAAKAVSAKKAAEKKPAKAEKVPAKKVAAKVAAPAKKAPAKEVAPAKKPAAAKKAEAKASVSEKKATEKKSTAKKPKK
ncbi:MAG: pyruvate, phosphate dikinase [Spirochaetes bacterium]|nr:pyruvate, phosphate dikinase [Spirochaetota bacterium]